MRGVYAKTSVYECVTGWDNFEPTLTLAEEVERDELWECAQSIPEEWYGSDTEGLQQLTDALYQRRSKIRRLIESFRTTAGNPFPNWKVDAKAQSTLPRTLPILCGDAMLN